MPTLCKYENCRNPAVYGFYHMKPLYCSEHRVPDSMNAKYISTVSPQTITNHNKCGHPPASTKYKGYCVNCYLATYPVDPLSLQTLYKSKIVAAQKYIDAKFDGFVHGSHFSQICINGKTLFIAFETTMMPNTGAIVIEFNLNKHADGSNPQLYTRLPKLEQIIATHIENIINL